MRALGVFLDARRIGELSEHDDLWRLDYDPAWIEARDGFDLSPALPRAARVHVDGASRRSVQWYFDNLLPEERLRETIGQEAGLLGDDAFALLGYLGAESAGSLVLLPPGQAEPAGGGLRPLDDAALCVRIRALPRETLASGAAKRMSAAGAQDKLLVVVRDDRLYEPVGAEPSTHLLKPDHRGDDYPASVINEYLVMTLARRVGLGVPVVQRRYTPEPVYVVERFDRATDAAGRTRRRHVIDGCQLLDRPRQAKYQAATLASLAEIVQRCRNRSSTRLRLYRWLVFNVLVGNNDNHLKNLSFTVDADAIALAPAYDLLCTAVYEARAYAQQRARWPEVEMAIALPGAARFGDVTRRSLIEAGEALGLAPRIASRELDRLQATLLPTLDELIAAIEAENAAAPDPVRPFLAREMRLARSIRGIVVAEMREPVSAS